MNAQPITPEVDEATASAIDKIFALSPKLAAAFVRGLEIGHALALLETAKEAS